MKFELYHIPYFTIPVVCVAMIFCCYKTLRSKTLTRQYQLHLSSLLFVTFLQLFLFAISEFDLKISVVFRYTGSLVFFTAVMIDCNSLDIFSSINTLISIKGIRAIQWTNIVLIIVIFTTSALIKAYEFSENRSTFEIMTQANNMLFPLYVLLAVAFHTIVHCFIFKTVYEALKGKPKAKKSMKKALKTLLLTLFLTIVSIPIYVWAEVIPSYTDPMKSFLLYLSLDLLGMNVIGTVALFKSISKVTFSAKRLVEKPNVPRNTYEIQCNTSLSTPTVLMPAVILNDIEQREKLSGTLKVDF
jgi:hypothetical protein